MVLVSVPTSSSFFRLSSFSGGPLSLLISLKLPLVNLLQAVSWPAVVLTDPGTAILAELDFQLGERKDTELVM
jgi:hypothetical protein